MTRLKDKTSADPRVNLDRLATYLEALPADYDKFKMESFLALNWRHSDTYKALAKYQLQNGSVQSCGTSACAVGHGPAAHMFLTEAETQLGPVTSWIVYCRRVFGCSQQHEAEAFEWMFGGAWSGVDNTVRGAAARIRYYLAHGVPDEFGPHNPWDQFVEMYR